MEGPDIEVSQAAEAGFIRHAVGHYNEEGPDPALGDQVVHDQMGAALVAPGGFILAPAVLQVEHRIALGRVLVVVGRRVDKRAARGPGALRGEENLLHSAVGHVLEGVEILVMGGDFDAAFPTRGAVEVQGAGVVECSPIDREMIVVKALVQRSCRGAHPGAVLGLGQGGAPASAQAHADALGLGRDDAESGVALGVDLRVLLARLIGGRGLEIVGLRGLTGLRQAQRTRQHQHQHGDCHFAFHRLSPCRP